MLQLRDTRIIHTKHTKVATGIIIAEEGVALVGSNEDGELVCSPSAGGDTGPFLGLSYERFAPPASVPSVKSYVIPSDLTIVLPRTPQAGQLGVLVNGTAVEVVAGAPADATEVKAAGDTLTFFAGEAGKTAKVTFIYTPTLEEARTLVGDGPFAGLSSSTTGIIGRFTQGRVGTSLFDAGADWTGALFVKLAAGGRFTPCAANDAARLTNVVLVNSPTGDSPFVVLDINVA